LKRASPAVVLTWTRRHRDAGATRSFQPQAPPDGLRQTAFCKQGGPARRDSRRLRAAVPGAPAHAPGTRPHRQRFAS